jgi:DNA-binding XRE family transcriptional regulator
MALLSPIHSGLRLLYLDVQLAILDDTAPLLLWRETYTRIHQKGAAPMGKKIGYRRFRHAPRPAGFAATCNPLAGYAQLNGERMAERRRAAGYSQADLARALGVPAADIARIELGQLFVTEPYASRIGKTLGDQLIAARVALIPVTYVGATLTQIVAQVAQVVA